jgi:3-oxoacyl-[acyl-carrier-protein] synthase II
VNAVAVTGLGAVSPHGDDPLAMFAALMRAESALRPVFPDLPKPAAAALAPFDETRWFTKLQLAGVDRVSQLAVAAADLRCATRATRPISTPSASASSPAAAWAVRRRSKPPTAAAGACRR